MAEALGVQYEGGVRIVDAAGSQGNMGLLQVRVDDTVGTVCGLDNGAADLVCRMLGYDYGTVGSNPCSSYGGMNVCGSVGSPVVMQALSCIDGSMDFDGCQWRMPDAACLTHELDGVVFCGLQISSGVFQDGALRLVAYDGAPSSDGTGRLDVFLNNHWGPVCGEGVSTDVANVACKQMGFSGVGPTVHKSCSSVAGHNFCSPMVPHASEFSCGGGELNIMSCAFEQGLDVFCAPTEAVVLSCVGTGDAQGRPKMLSVAL